MTKKLLLLFAAGFFGLSALAQEDMSLEEELFEEVSVTATRTEVKTREVSSSVAVIGEEEIADKAMQNVKEALSDIPGVQAESKNGGYDTRLAIRGAGLKAAYGVREIMVLLNGVPITDPDSFTRLDLVDPQNIEKIEVVKGPNSTLWGANAAGGVINIITKNPLKDQGGKINLGGGSFGTLNAGVGYGDKVSESFSYNLSLNHRSSENDWRRWNKFSTNQFSFQPTYTLQDGSLIETRIAYSEADFQLPGSLDETMFENYKKTGKADETSGLWQYSGRYSGNFYFSTRLKKQLGNLEFIPMLFLNSWNHHHPVYGRINDAMSNNLGMDFQFNQKMGSNKLTYGLTWRTESSDTNYFEYGDTTVETTFGWAGPVDTITAINSDATGNLIETVNRATSLWGLYLQDTISATESLKVDMGVRYDQIDFDINGHQDRYFSGGSSNYVDCDPAAEDCDYSIAKSFKSISPRVGVNYQISESWNLFGNVAKGVQTPTQGELMANTELELVTSTNKEIGFKGRGESWSIDTSVYVNDLENEVVQMVNEFGATEYQNAGKTKKKGFEFAGKLQAGKPWTFGFNYTVMDFRFVEFYEPVGFGPSATLEDRSGNRIAFSPENQSSFNIKYKDESGFKMNLRSESIGSYAVDNENSEFYEGYQFVTSLMLGYELNDWDLKMNVENLTDKRYAVEVKKSYGNKYYNPAAPRNMLVSVSTKF